MVDKTLPNGRIIANLPDGISDEDVKRIALLNNLATEEDYNKDTATGYDSLGFAGELGAGVAGSIKGATMGAAFGPVGAFAGGIAGGAIGAFVGRGVGESLEAFGEDRDPNAAKIIDQSWDAFKEDALFGTIFGTAGKVIGRGARPIFERFSGGLAKSDELLKAEALHDVKLGIKSIDEAAADFNMAPDQLKRFQEDLLKDENTIIKELDLLDRLEAKGLTMFPSQTSSRSLKGKIAEDYSKSSIFRDDYIKMLEQHDAFIRDSFADVLKKSQGTLSRDEIGQSLSTLRDASELALRENAGALFRNIDRKGKILIKTAPVKLELRKFEKIPNLDAASQAVINRFKKLDVSLTPKMLTKELATIRETFKDLPPEMATANKILKNGLSQFESKMKGPQFVQTAGVDKAGREAQNYLINKYGRAGIEGDFLKRAQRLTEMRPTMSFSEAHQELSNLKKLQRDMDGSLGAKDSQAHSLITKAVGALDESMKKTAKRLGKGLEDEYKVATSMYRDGLQTINGDWIVKALNKDNPAQVARMLVESGEQVGVDSVKKLINKAKELKVDVDGKSLINSIERVYLNNLFPTQSIQEAERFTSNMMKEGFRDTFNAIVGKEKGNLLAKVAEDVNILTRNLKGSDSASSLAIRGREIGAVTDPTIAKTSTLLLIQGMIDKQLSPAEIRKNLVLVQQMNKMLNSGKKIPKPLAKRLIDNSGLLGTNAGLALGALID